MSESEGFPDPTKSFTDPTFAPWLYALPWYSNEQSGVPCNVLNARVNNSYMINASDLPDFNGNIPTPTIAPYRGSINSGLSSDMQWRNLRIPSLGSITLTITNAAGATMGTYDRASLMAGLRKAENLPKEIYFVTIASSSAKSIATHRIAKTF